MIESTIYKKEIMVNEKIYDFYNKNPQLNFEKINMDFIHILENMLPTETIMPYLKSCSMEMLLSKSFPCNEISINADKNYMLKRITKSNILFMCKTDLTNIESHYTDLFIKHIKETKGAGVFISQHSGIITKPDFHIDIVNNNVVIYIHNCNYDIDKIKNAINIIDILTEKLKLSTNNEEDQTQIVIEKDLLSTINAEYQTYIVSKEQLIQTIKESHKHVIHKLETFTFPILETYLSKNFTNKEHKQKYTCNICNNYISFKLKGMAAHKKGCKRKLLPFVSVV
jgi:hypothetical protein